MLARRASLTGSPSITGAELRIPDGVTVTVPAGATMLLDGGGITGAGTVRIAGTLTWRDGGQLGPGTTVDRAGRRRHARLRRPPEPCLRRAHRQPLARQRGHRDGRQRRPVRLRRRLDPQPRPVRRDRRERSRGLRLRGRVLGAVPQRRHPAQDGRDRRPRGIALDNDGTIEVLGGNLDAFGLLNYTATSTAASAARSSTAATSCAPAARSACRARSQVIAGDVVLDGAGSKVTITTSRAASRPTRWATCARSRATASSSSRATRRCRRPPRAACSPTPAACGSATARGSTRPAATRRRRLRCCARAPPGPPACSP